MTTARCSLAVAGLPSYQLVQVRAGQVSLPPLCDSGLVAEINELPFVVHPTGAQLPVAEAYEWHAVSAHQTVVIAGECWFLATSPAR